ncbi:MAG: T9SS type A sorting domain-containing protein [Sphingobacteriaceae bacterium]|nr:T9SS type A sorting domain-containing protein [Sphingobacteriaceae bacterium]
MKKLLLSTIFFSTIFSFAQPSIQLVKTTGANASSNMVVLSNKLFLQATDAAAGIELFTSDGTTSGTTMLKNIVPGSGDSNPRFFKNALGKVLFRAGSSPFSDSLYITDGTITGTKSLCKLSLNAIPADGVEMNSKFYFINGISSTGDELWVTDGTLAGTQLVKDIASGTSASNIEWLTVLGNKLFFKANDNTSTSGDELWTSDGTVGGTILFKDIYTGAQGSGLRGLTVYNSKIYFGADNSTNGNELWVCDGTLGGTSMLKDILPGSTGSAPFGFANFNGKLYFAADGNLIAREFFETDGTLAGTILNKDIDAGTLSSNPQGLYPISNNLFFTARLTNSCGYELMSFSSVTNSVNLMTDAFPGMTTGFQSVVNAYGEYNITNFGTSAVITAYEANNLQNIWISDGTSGGTSKVLLTGPAYTNASQSYLTPFNNDVYFFAKYGTGIKSLYKLTGASVGIKETQNQLINFSIYPNPAKELLNVKLETLNNEPTLVKITNLLGQNLLTETATSNEFKLSLNNLNSGVYFVTIENKGKQSTQKIIVE